MPATLNQQMMARDLAKLLQVSVRNVWRLRSAGRLPAPIRIARVVRWDRRDIDGCKQAIPLTMRLSWSILYAEHGR